MKKLILTLAIALLSFGSASATPQFKGLSNRHGKTTVIIEFSSSDLSKTTVIRDWKLHNNGKVYDVKKVNVKGSNGNTFILEFRKFTEFSDCTLSFTVNGDPVSIDIQSRMNR
ncbi:MAG: hypothetical protein HFJ91_11015 [Muribaculaceae bacterium]|nr:hypothetical protein [Muribaculaceae bacterium]